MPSGLSHQQQQKKQQLEQEIDHLKRRLEHSEHLLQQRSAHLPSPLLDHYGLHSLLLISDSALPLGSFAYSNGLESYVAHHKPLPPSQTPLSSFRRFLSLSISSLASTTLPYLLQAHRRPEDLLELDDDLDASTLCTVARRASLAQGLALLNVWERSFRSPVVSAASELCNEETLKSTESDGSTSDDDDDSKSQRRLKAYDSLAAFSSALKKANSPSQDDRASGHLAPLWGVFSIAMGIGIDQSAYVFMLNHAKAVLSAAVRASILGPYQAQAILASKSLQTLITQQMTRNWETAPEDAGQITPVMDLWVGRHELLYSRIFNS